MKKSYIKNQLKNKTLSLLHCMREHWWLLWFMFTQTKISTIRKEKSATMDITFNKYSKVLQKILHILTNSYEHLQNKSFWELKVIAASKWRKYKFKLTENFPNPNTTLNLVRTCVKVGMPWYTFEPFHKCSSYPGVKLRKNIGRINGFRELTNTPKRNKKQTNKQPLFQ